jgi:CRP-like cAMP-binding protein
VALVQPVRPDDPLAGCGLFSGLTASQRATIASLITERTVQPGAVLVREGDAAAELFIIQEGSVEVTKLVAAGDRERRISILPEGATLGEMTLIDRSPRSATVRAIERTRVGVLSMDRLADVATVDPGIERQLLRNLANELSRRVRFTNETTVAALEHQLELERTRAIMGRFVVFLAFTMVTYTFTLKLAIEALPAGLNPSAITVPIILLYSVMLYGMMRRSGLPFESFGVTLRNWRPAVREALLWTLVTCVAATVFKQVLIWTSSSFADERLFNLTGVFDPRTSWADLQTALLLALIYAAAAPLQEFIVRSGLQASLQHCLVGPTVAVRSIVISNAMFASAHLHLSISFAVFAFFPGLLWGALFARKRSLVGVSVSHILCGWFAFLVLGFEPWY